MCAVAFPNRLGQPVAASAQGVGTGGRTGAEGCANAIASSVGFHMLLFQPKAAVAASQFIEIVKEGRRNMSAPLKDSRQNQPCLATANGFSAAKASCI